MTSGESEQDPNSAELWREAVMPYVEPDESIDLLSIFDSEYRRLYLSQDLVSILPPEITRTTPEDQERFTELVRKARVILGYEMLDVLNAGEELWGDVDAKVELRTYSINHDGEKVTELTDEASVIKSGMSAFDIADALERSRRPVYDSNAVREGQRLHIDLTDQED